jgi:quinolinate synthase
VGNEGKVTMDGVERVRRLARERRAVVLAHHYEVEEVRRSADHTGDSYRLAVLASTSGAEVIVLAGVRFMAETAAILAPGKKVLLPNPEAGCPLADTVTAADVRRLREANPGVPVVCYVNTTAEVKALSDYCCTSANAAALVRGIGAPRVIFIPDGNLADWVARSTGVEVIRWGGSCPVHQRVRAEDVLRLREASPGAVFIAHPECRPEVVALADEVASTAGFFRLVESSAATTFIVGTEEEVAVRLRAEHPGRTFLMPREGMVCPNMKLTTLDDVARALELLEPAVALPEETASRARQALERMVAVAG